MTQTAPRLALENVEIDSSQDPTWYRDAVIYQLNVKAFNDTNGDGIGDFKGVTERLDYVKELGVNTIWLMPFYPSPLRDDGYDISEYCAVNPQFGTLEDFKEMLDAAHERGLRVITELVINHTSSDHPWFQRARQAPAGSPERNFYVWSDTDQIYQGTRIIFTDTETSNWAWDPVAKQYYWHRFFSHQPDLNFDNPDVLEAVFGIMRFWLDMGVDGFRLDAIPYLIERDGTSNENLPETHDVIKKLRAAIDANYTNRFLLAEANMWPEDVREYFGTGDECHMCYHFPLMPRMYMAIAQEDRDPIVEILQQTPDIPDGCQWAIFLRNHDELTLEMVTNRERDYMYSTYAADKQARINLGIRRRLAPLMGNDKDRIKLMNGMLLSMPGSPIIYYGDEIGMGDNVFVGDRNGVRTPMQWSNERNAGFSRADPQRLYLQPIMDPIYGYEAVNVEAQLRDQSSLLHWTRRMLAVRKTSRAFGRGRKTFLKPGNRKVLAYLSEYEGEVILTVFNLSRAAQPVELDLGAFKGRVPVELLGRSAFPPIGELPYMLTMPSYGFFWFRLATDVDVPSWHQEGLQLRDRPVLVLFDGWSSLFRERVMPWRIGMADRLREQFEVDVMPRHLEVQRWYAAKGEAIQRVGIADYAAWEQGERAYVLPLLDVQAGSGSGRYFMPLGLAWEELDEETIKQYAPAVIAKVRQQAQVGVMGDAMYDPAFAHAVAVAMAQGLVLPATGGEIRFTGSRDLTGVDAAAIQALPVSRPSVASSNTALTFGDQLFFKCYRRVQPGINPELEIGRFLTETVRFANCVPVAGAVEYHGNDGTVMTLGLLQAFVPNQGDAWDYTLAYLERALAEHQAAPEAAQVDHGAFLALMRLLGQRTAEMHLAFAAAPADDPAFAPEPLTAEDREALRLRAHDDARATLSLLAERLPTLGEGAQGDGRQLIERQAQLLDRIAAFDGVGTGGIKTRLHGDYHLGQVLVSRNDFILIDFEGEPARSIDERRAKGPALRDVAGMLRSFNYARWSALKRVAQNVDELARLNAVAADWEAAVRAAYLGGYRDTLAHAGAEAPDEALMSLFEIDKALYELRYELNNRIDWAQVPLQGLLALARAPGAPEASRGGEQP
ncbi:maltose alpha-D-glucosyltransferase [uncultured Pseudacidovorax sp.]|uniref:maltose alpha-D-glucosyltransferase n=1 Tax=uncultured Pseudacidovorax sp. TaxID=679313 RepID=UPI0025EBDE93|nr:maltose alpha-D-glucosyltransferase [uncultured Pseudacidovorax sp.]